MTTSNPVPKRSEVWLVNFDPTVGTEIKKIRRAVVVSSDAVGRLPLKLVIPLTEWKPYFANNIWHVQIAPDKINGLTKTSAADALQLRGVDVQRFVRFLGQLSDSAMEEITIAIAAVIEYTERN